MWKRIFDKIYCWFIIIIKMNIHNLLNFNWQKTWSDPELCLDFLYKTLQMFSTFQKKNLVSFIIFFFFLSFLCFDVAAQIYEING